MSDKEAASAARKRLASNAEPPELLYHYTQPTTGVSILQSREIRLSPYADTQDPREIQSWVYNGIDAVRDAYPEAEEVFDRILRRSVRLACFTVDREPAPEAAIYSQYHRGWARASMWDRYGDQRAGMCLVFDRDKLVRALAAEAQKEITQANKAEVLSNSVDSRMYTADKVKYLDQQAVVALRGVIDPKAALVSHEFRRVTDELYMIKGRDWAGEREYRLIASCPDLDDGDCFKLPIVGSLVAVVVGEKFSGLRPPEAGDVPVFRCTWSGGAPELADFTESVEG